ncbi:hypothetical protein FQR65_LT09920 [Abscondita terminalis]|nr:hypothetical protein FQR65_LT09920 [Abscondita terminalis]
MRLKIATVLVTVFLTEVKFLHTTEVSEENNNSDYSFSYGVKDVETGDVKDQWESKKDGVVKGRYSVMEAGGKLRTVEYVADKEHGFNAVVKYNTNSLHPIPSSHQEVELEMDPPKVQELILENKFSESNLRPVVAATSQPKPTPYKPKHTTYKTKPMPHKLKPIQEKEQPQPLNFPIDLSFLESNSKIIPLTISKITPVEIKVDDLLTEKQKLKGNNYRFSQPFSESDFQPILSKINSYSATLKREKKPLNTLGLKHYATGQVPNVKAFLQQEAQEKKILNNFPMTKLRPNGLKRPSTLIAVKYM